jgi:imidazolonepropionase-like amidohydrolase
MSTHAILLAALVAGAGEPPRFPQFPPLDGGLLAIRVGRAETISHGTIEHAVLLIDGAKIVVVGQDLPIERGIPVLDRPEWTVMPGLVNPYSRLGMDGRATDREEPQLSAKAELYPRAEEYEEVLELGVTTLGQYPAGRGVPGKAVSVRPKGATPEEMLLAEDSYLKIYFESTARAKKRLRDAFKKVDEYIEKEKKAREKWEKDQEKKKKDSEKKDTEKKDGEKKEGEKKEEPKEGEKKDEVPAKYVPPAPDEKVAPFIAVREKRLDVLASISTAGDYLHWIDAIGEEEFDWSLRIPVVRELDIFLVKDKLGERKVRVLMEPEITVHPNTMRYRNPAAELAEAGAKLVLLPRSDTIFGHRQWLQAVGEVVAYGLDRQTALRAVTLEGATLLGLEGRLGSLEEGKDANLLFLSGDPLEASTRVEAVMLEGRFVHGEVQQ